MTTLITTIPARKNETANLADLKPCPFCGSTDLEFSTDPQFSFVDCNECTAAGPVGKTEKVAAELWNERNEP